MMEPGSEIAVTTPGRRSHFLAGPAALLFAFSFMGATLGPAGAFSEFQREEMPAEDAEDAPPPAAEPAPGDVQRVPLPDPILPVPSAPAGDPGAEGEELPAQPARPHFEADAPLPEIIYDLERLPAPALRMRELIIEACASGDIEALRPLIGFGPDATQVSFGASGDDPIDILRDLSGDEGAQEILAILWEVLEAGYVHLDPGTPRELFVWPYFFAVPLESLTPPQRVELFRLVTAGDYEDMKSFGSYIFYRVGISPEGRWEFFVAGD